MTRRRFLGGVSLAGIGTASYARFFEAERLQFSQVAVPLSGGAREPLKLLHLSDLHASPVVSLGYIESAIVRGLEWKPDLICLTGDFITQRFERDKEFARALRRLSDTAPCFATLGNHDGGDWAGGNGGHSDVGWITSVLNEGGITLLPNATARLRLRDWPLQLVGVGDTWAGNFDPQTAFRAATPDATTVLLSHNPDTKEQVAPHPWNLMLSGHTHGGQLRVPWLGATPFAPVRDKRFVAGLHRWNERWIHVTTGIGSVFGVRINCPPEVSCLTLT